MIERLIQCECCPHQCKVNRMKGQIGRCKAKDKVKIALSSIHWYEEPCISGTKGSGTIFFSNCNLSCIFCQNFEISQQEKGKEYTVEELADMMLKQQEKGVHNINLVTPTIYAYQIREALRIAKEKGLHIPVIYNTNAYENIETLKQLEGFIDIYLPDFKYYDDKLGEKYSKVENYFEIATKALKEMKRQVGNASFDEEGILKRGMLIRHLVLPNYLENSRKVLMWIKENLGIDTYVSVMAQYFPTYLAKQDEKIGRKLTKREYNRIANYLYSLGLENGYMQELSKWEEEYVPNWDKEN